MNYGWIPDLPDHRDFRYHSPAPGPLPSLVDLRATCPDVWDQGDIGSCTAHAIVGALVYDEIKRGDNNPVMLSRLYLYYFERSLEGTTTEDAGAMIRDGIKVAAQGVCPEKYWPYVPSRFAIRPTKSAIKRAKEKAIAYERLDNTNLFDLRACLSQDNPFTFGFTVYESFESEDVARNGVVPMPEPNESVMGGHAVLAVGYDDSQKMFMVRNSWGQNWGQNGYFQMPYAYLTDANLADDFWTIKAITA